MLTFQLLSKDGSSLDDAEVLSGRWQAYVEGFVSETETPGVAASKVRQPFLRRYVLRCSSHFRAFPISFPNPLTGFFFFCFVQIDAKGTTTAKSGGE